MKTPLPSTSRRGAFTLVEILVAMTVLALLVYWISHLTSVTQTSISQSRRYIDADSQARLVFSRMSVEFSKMLQRPDLDFSNFKNALSPSPAPSVSASTTPNPQTGSGGGGNDSLAFYTFDPGYYSGTSTSFVGNARAPISLVAYNVQADSFRHGVPNLQRTSKAVGWDPDTSGASPAGWQAITYLPVTIDSQWPNLFPTNTGYTAPDADYTTIGDQVFRFEYQYLIKPRPPSATTAGSSNAAVVPAHLSIYPYDAGATAPTRVNQYPTNYAYGLKDVAAIIVAIAVLDPTSRIIVPASSIPTLAAAFPDAVDSGTAAGNTDIQASWVAVINSPTFAATASIPQAAAGAVRVYQRYFYLDGQQ